MSENKEKGGRISSEEYGKKKYFEKKNIKNVRIQFRARYKMLPFAGNYGKDRRFSHSEWLCYCGEEKEEESHLLGGRCRIYGDIRDKYGELEDDEDLITFFNEVLERREELEARGMENEDTLVVETTDDASCGDSTASRAGSILVHQTDNHL